MRHTHGEAVRVWLLILTWADSTCKCNTLKVE